jgi:fucose permease
LILGVTAFLLSVVMLSLMPPFFVFLLILLPLGFGMATLDAGLNAYIAGLPRNTAQLNYLHAFYGAGALLGPIVASTILAIGLGWNNVYVVWAALSLLLLTGFALAFKVQRATSEDGKKAEARSNVLFTALRLRIVWIAALFLLFYVGTEVSLGSWSYSFLTEERHGSTLIMGWVVSGYWAGLTLGRLTLAKVAQRIGEKRLIQSCLAGIIVGILLVWLVPISAVSAIGLCLVGFSLGPIFPTTIALMSKFVSSRLLPSAIGFLASLGSLGGALFPLLAGNLAQAIGLWSLLPYIITLTIFMLCLWIALLAHPKVREDVTG